MNESNTPSSMLYATLRQLGISNKDAAAILLTSTRSIGGEIPANRVTDKTWLSRYVVNAQPGEMYAAYFSDFAQSAQTLCQRAIKKQKAVTTYEELVAFLCGEPTAAMANALNFYGLDGVLFTNMVNKAAATQHVSAADIASLEMLIFTATGCLGDLNQMVELAQQFSSFIAPKSFKTELAGVAPTAAEAKKQTHLGLVRIEDGALDLANIKPLSEAPEGTIIGSMATGDSCITNVGAAVSRKHARVFLAPDGQWYVEGLGSTNGTTLVRGSDKMEIVVEPPRKQRTGSYPPVPIQISDALCLAGSTVFMVMLIK